MSTYATWGCENLLSFFWGMYCVLFWGYCLDNWMFLELFFNMLWELLNYCFIKKIHLFIGVIIHTNIKIVSRSNENINSFICLYIFFTQTKCNELKFTFQVVFANYLWMYYLCLIMLLIILYIHWVGKLFVYQIYICLFWLVPIKQSL